MAPVAPGRESREDPLLRVGAPVSTKAGETVRGGRKKRPLRKKKNNVRRRKDRDPGGRQH